MYKYFLRFFVTGYIWVLKIVSRSERKKSIADGNESVLLATATFYSENWLTTHLLPISRSKGLNKVVMVASDKVPYIEKVEAVYPPRFLTLFFGNVASRLLYFSWVAIKTKPEFICGFHLLLNGMVSVLIAKITGAKSIYICGGGPREVLGGGYSTENRIFGRLREPDYVLERKLISVLDYFDLIVVMGTSAKDYFVKNSVKTRISSLPGGFDKNDYFPIGFNDKKEFDLIFVGRLSEIKRVDRLIHAIQIVQARLPTISLVIVGDGPDKMQLEGISRNYGLEENICFAGWKKDIGVWLRKSRIFILTSDSEGVSQAMIQALMCGLPCIVSDVGDLKDVIVTGYNGYLINEKTPEEFAESIVETLDNYKNGDKLMTNAIDSANKYSVDEVSKSWQKELNSI